MLVQHAYEKKGMRNYDGYAVYLGKVLDDNMFLADCKLCNNCTLEVRGRGRGGEKEVRILCKTFDEEMKDVELFSMVPFPKTLTNTQTLKTSATFLSVPCQWRARQVLISLGRLHFRGKSFNGKFNANHILFYDGRVVFDECLKEVDFTKDTGKNDCRVIAGIYGHKFRVPGEESYPLFVLDLLWYLSECPLGDKSNSVAGIALLVSHPALTTFIDRMGQVSTLDSMVDRFTEKDLGLFDIAVGKFETWGAIANNVPAMWKTLAHDPRKKDADSEANPEAINDPRKMDADSEADPEAINWERTSYTDQPRSCLKFCRNHLKHTHISNLLERVEGSLCLNFGDFLPQMLRDIVQKFDPPPLDIVGVLGNHVVDMKRARDVVDPKSKENAVAVQSPANVTQPPAKRPRISFGFSKTKK